MIIDPIGIVPDRKNPDLIFQPDIYQAIAASKRKPDCEDCLKPFYVHPRTGFLICKNPNCNGKKIGLKKRHNIIQKGKNND